ncbi:MAG: arginine deiminase family protein [Gammaproteobacteria bacterium]
MSRPDTSSIVIRDEFSELKRVIIGLGSPYQRDKAQVASEMHEFPFLPNTDRKEQVLALTYPTEEILEQEYIAYVAALEKYGVEVLRADPDAAYSFDYTCPRDIGFVVGDMFFISSMAVKSRTEEHKTILAHLEDIEPGRMVWAPEDSLVEGGDVIVMDEKTVLVGINQRTNQKGFDFLKNHLRPLGYETIPVPHRQLHLDCCLAPLGMGHLLIHPDSLEQNTNAAWDVLKNYEWISVDADEREHLATNILSIDPNTIIARSHPSCARVNGVIRALGYSVEEIEFDGVPATGGSFRCASLVLSRQH